MFDSLKFWKKDDELPSLDEHFNDPVDNNFDDKPFNPRTEFQENPNTVNSPFGQVEQVRKSQDPDNSFDFDSSSRKMLEKDIELLSSKLDTIKATIDSMNQRLQHIEKIAEKEDKGWQ